MKILYPPEYQAKLDLVTLMPPDPNWLAKAQTEIAALKKILPQNSWLDIQHIGSTAIPNITAKPIIDIAIAVESLESVSDWLILLHELGYLHLEIPDMTDRIFLVKGLPPFGHGRTHHVHIVEKTSGQWQDWLTFRDYVIAHPEAAEEYASLKTHLYHEHAGIREVYTMGKTQFIEEILARARR